MKINNSKRLIQRFLILVLITFMMLCYFKLKLIRNPVIKHPRRNDLLDFADFHYIISNDICTMDNIFLLIIIHSASSHFQHRKLIRNTWGQPDLTSENNIKVVFLLAAAPRIQTDIDRESDHYKDIVQGNFIDSYHNLTYKHAMGLKWASENCAHAKYLMKMDDDIFIDMFQWLEYVTKHFNPANFAKSIACFVQSGMPVVRDPVSKWYVSKEEYRNDLFENYCSGWAYLTSTRVAHDLYKKLQTLEFFWVDDVFVTGSAAKLCNISHIRINNLFDLESNGLIEWSLTEVNALWNKMFAPTWDDLQLSRVAYRKTLQCWVTGCKCCYSRKTTVPPTRATTTRRGVAKLLSL